MLASSIDYNDYVGRIAIGRIVRGKIRKNMEVTVTDYKGNITPYKAKVSTLYQIEGLSRTECEEAMVGDLSLIHISFMETGEPAGDDHPQPRGPL